MCTTSARSNILRSSPSLRYLNMYLLRTASLKVRYLWTRLTSYSQTRTRQRCFRLLHQTSSYQLLCWRKMGIMWPLRLLVRSRLLYSFKELTLGFRFDLQMCPWMSGRAQTCTTRWVLSWITILKTLHSMFLGIYLMGITWATTSLLSKTRMG